MRLLLTILLAWLTTCKLLAFEFLPTQNGELVKHAHYALSYIKDHEQAEWVYYELDANLIAPNEKRTNNFRADPAVSTGSAAVVDYKNSGFDRGHLAPAASMTGNKTAMSESFYMSNMSPQHPSLNRGKWQELEDLVRKWVLIETSADSSNQANLTNAKLYVVTGTILNAPLGTIGKNNVTIPSHYYKIIYNPAQNKMIAFLLPNQKLDAPLETYIVSVDTIEDLATIDFFPQLEDNLEDKLERILNITEWCFN